MVRDLRDDYEKNASFELSDEMIQEIVRRNLTAEQRQNPSLVNYLSDEQKNKVRSKIKRECIDAYVLKALATGDGTPEKEALINSSNAVALTQVTPLERCNKNIIRLKSQITRNQEINSPTAITLGNVLLYAGITVAVLGGLTAIGLLTAGVGFIPPIVAGIATAVSTAVPQFGLLSAAAFAGGLLAKTTEYIFGGGLTDIQEQQRKLDIEEAKKDAIENIIATGDPDINQKIKSAMEYFDKPDTLSSLESPDAESEIMTGLDEAPRGSVTPALDQSRASSAHHTTQEQGPPEVSRRPRPG